MTDEETTPVFQRGDVVFGNDSFRNGKTSRPWLILTNHGDRPFHGEQYIALTLTTKSWMDDLIEIPETEWIRGGTPAESRIVPWGVQSIAHEDIDFWQGRLEGDLIDDAVDALVAELQQ